jgi:tRNA(Ile)-lysidine synthetase-like protein
MNRQPRFVKEIVTALTTRCGVSAGDRLLVAVSGGADSVALLRVLSSLSQKRGRSMTLGVAHVQHHLREQAAIDARFVAQLATSLGLPHFQRDLACPADCGNVEQWARVNRYQALADMAGDFDASSIVTAHHGDDQLETVLMRLMRGSGVQGLGGMKWSRPLAKNSTIQLIRPMLGCTHEQALAYLQSIDQPWCTDHTNADITRTRAALRLQVLPALRQIAPHAARRVVQNSEQLQDMALLYEQMVASVRRQDVLVQGGRWVLPRDVARRYPGVILQGVVRTILQEAGVPADRLGSRQVTQLADAIQDTQGGRRVYRFAGEVTATLSREMVSIAHEEA